MIPFGIFHTRPSRYRAAKEMGFNLVHYNNNEWLADVAIEMAGDLGLAVFSDPHVLTSGRFTIGNKHRALSFLYISDEPDLHGFNPDAVRRNSDYFKCLFEVPTIATISPNWHKYLPWYRRAPFFNYLRYRSTADIIGVDVYRTPNAIKNHLRWNVKPALMGKDWWGIVDIHRPVAELWPSIKVFLDAGASGILCYAWTDEGWGFDLSHNPEIQLEISRISGLLNGKD